MVWPAAQVKTNFDAGTDDPKLARGDFAANVDKFNQLQAHVTSYMQGLLDDADAAAARTTLGLGTAAVKNTGTSGDALGLLNASVDFSNAFHVSGTVSPAQITANQNNYNPSGLTSAVQLRLTSDASRNVTGLQGGATGRLILIANVGSFDIVLTSEDALSTAANRFLFAGGDRTLTANESVLLRYDGTSSRWRAAHDVVVVTGGITRGTPINVNTGSSAGFTGIQAGADRITIMLEKISLNSIENFEIQIGDSGGYETTGYVSRTSQGTTSTTSTSGFIAARLGAATDEFSGCIELYRRDGNTWVSSGNLDPDGSGAVAVSAGLKTLSAELDRVQIITVATFDGVGKANILVE